MARREGVPVDAILDRFAPEEFDELVALEVLEHDPDERLREIIKAGFAASCLAQVDPDDFDPWADREVPVASPGKVEDLARQTFGGA